MPLTKFEIKRIEKIVGDYLEHNRPPANIRNEIDLGCRVTDHSVEIFEIRPLWNNPKEKTETPVAKETKRMR